jgi:signal transduction histidine kinase
MSSRRYTPEQVSLVVESLANPALAVREGRLAVVNAAFAETLSVPPGELAGRPFTDVVAPGERRRLAERYARLLEGAADDLLREPTTHRLAGPDGRVRELRMQVSVLPAAEGPPWHLCSFMALAERQQEVDLAERVVEAAAELVAARSEAQVRRAAREGLRRAGLTARFLSPAGTPLPGEEPPGAPPGAPPGGGGAAEGAQEAEAGGRAAEALASGRVLFEGVEGRLASRALLPLQGAGEVLLLTGAPLPATSTSVLALFARVLEEALAGVRLLEQAERRSAHLSAVAEVARLAAEPTPPALEALLARVVEVAGAGGACLRIPGQEAPLAHVGTLAPAAGGREGGRDGARAGGVERLEVPLALGGEAGAVLEVQREGGSYFSDESRRLLQTLGDLLRCVLEQRRLRQEAGRQLTETQLLLELARTTAGTLDMASILDVACDYLVKLLGVSSCLILLQEEEEGVLRGAGSSASHRLPVRELRLDPAGPGLAARVARERRPLAVEDVTRAAPGELHPELLAGSGARAVLALPLLSREELIGVVVLDDTRGPRRFPPEALHLADATVGQIALAIANARLYESLWRSYAELAATRAEMVKRERLAALGELSAIVAHEVRNPLGVIFNAVSSLRRLVRPNGDAGMLLDILAEESDRLNRIVGDLLDFSRPRDLELHPEDVGALVHDAVDAARVLPQGGGGAVTFTTEVVPGLPPVPVDRRLIRQALLNVMVNATQAMSRGGRVQVRAGREQHDGQEFLRIDVADEGPGIPPELLARVFEPFFTTKAKGTGLGLAVVRRILDEHRGEVEVHSRMGAGTTFTFRLPLAQASSGALGRAAGPGAGGVFGGGGGSAGGGVGVTAGGGAGGAAGGSGSGGGDE